VSPTESTVAEPTSPAQRQLLERYVAAFESYDVAGIVKLFTEDAIWEMPPYTGWYQGPDTIGELIAGNCPAKGPGDMTLVPTSANGQPAFAVYMRGDDGMHRAFQLHVLSLSGDRVAHVVSFFDVTLFPAFGLPGSLQPEPQALSR
jgi:RNA polymerase sigma-70 factor, ECF subfamily